MGNEIRINKETIDSFVFFALGITLEDSAEIVVEAIIRKAYTDATNQGAFNTLLTSPEIKELSEQAQMKVFNVLKEELMNYMSKGDGYYSWYEQMCLKIYETYQDVNCGEERFSYGNSQKLINMSMKYLYMLSNISNYDDCPKELRKVLDSINKDKLYLIIPIDRYILDALCKEGKLTSSLEKIKGRDGLKKNIGEVKHPSDYLKGWSTWEKDEYEAVYSELRQQQGVISLEWEEKTWIKEVKNRNSK